jgi:hypothetical protein
VREADLSSGPMRFPEKVVFLWRIKHAVGIAVIERNPDGFSFGKFDRMPLQKNLWVNRGCIHFVHSTDLWTF